MNSFYLWNKGPLHPALNALVDRDFETVVVIYARNGLEGFSNFIPSPTGKEDEESCEIKKLQCIKGSGNFL